MAKKFLDDSAPGMVSQDLSGIDLDRYLALYAPDVLVAIQESGRPMVEFWTSIFEPQKPHEAKKIKGNALDWPYANRLIYLARKFKTSKTELRDLVLEASGLKIFWRGDDYSMFDRIVTEIILFRRLEPHEKSAYKKKLWGVAMSLSMRHESSFA